MAIIFRSDPMTGYICSFLELSDTVKASSHLDKLITHSSNHAIRI